MPVALPDDQGVAAYWARIVLDPGPSSCVGIASRSVGWRGLCRPLDVPKPAKQSNRPLPSYHPGISEALKPFWRCHLPAVLSGSLNSAPPHGVEPLPVPRPT